jgi:hypothetical protein
MKCVREGEKKKFDNLLFYLCRSGKLKDSGAWSRKEE